MSQPIASKRKPKVANLATVGQVATELGRVYRSMVRGEIDNETGRAREAVLTACRQALEVTDVERRLIDLENRR